MMARDNELPLLQQLQPARIVVFRALQLGDMLCAIPALRALRAAAGNAHIALVSLPWARQFTARFAHYIDEFIDFPGHPDFPEQPVRQALLDDFYTAMQVRRFDLAIQLHGSGPASNSIVQAFGARVTAGFGEGTASACDVFIPYPDHGHESRRLLALVRALGAPTSRLELEFPITTDDELELAEHPFAGQLAQQPYVCIHPGARAVDKRWPPACFAQVAAALSGKHGVQIVLTGSSAEQTLTAAVARHLGMRAIDTAAWSLSVGAMAAILRGARLLVANDTGVSHIAAGLGLPSVIIFSNADMRRWAPDCTQLHRCMWDPAGSRVDAVVASALGLLEDRFDQQCNAEGAAMHLAGSAFQNRL